MRKLVILISIAAFIAYCFAAAKYHSTIELPAYKKADVNILGGKTWTAWEADSAFQSDVFQKLDKAAYQPLPGGLKFADGTVIPEDRALGIADFKKLIEERRGSVDVVVPLRDTHAIHSVVLRAYHLRNPNPEFGFKGGEKLDKAMIDKLLDASVKRVAVVGKGDPVSAQPGTMALIILIFLGLTYTLQIILWDPVLKIIDERKKEIEDGSYLVRQNRRDEIRIQEEAVKLRSDARRSYLNKLMATQNQARSEADKIYREARIEGKLMRDKAQSELNKVVDEVRGELKPQVPELAREIANQLLNRA